MSFVQRQIDVIFQLGQGQFGQSGYNTVKVSGLRCSAKVINAGGAAMPSLHLQVFGLTFDLMNQLSTLGQVATLQRRNLVTVLAGDAVGGMFVVFVGTIVNAYADFASQPEVPFVVQAQSGALEAVLPTAAATWTGVADVAAIMQSLATGANLNFEPNGVNIKLASPYLHGSLREQIKSVADAAGIQWCIINGTLAIWYSGAARQQSSSTIQAPLVSPGTGMKGYPSYMSLGILVQTIFNPAIIFGGAIVVQSSLGDAASGTWIVVGLDHQLDAMVPHGQWFSSIKAVRSGVGPVAPSMGGI